MTMAAKHAASFTHLLFNWRAWLFLACMALLGCLCASPVASQSPPEPVLSVVGSGGMAMPGDEVTYQIRLLNWTDEVISGGAITHTLPPGISYVPGSAQVAVGGWPITQTEPMIQDLILSWGAFRLPAAGHTAHNPYGAHTFVQDFCLPEFVDFQLDQALELVGSGGYVTQLFYRITPETTGPDPCAIYFLDAAYDRNLIPILRLQGVWNPVGFWEKPDPGPKGDYADIAAAYARYVAGLPRRTTHPLYLTIWNEPDLWVEWSGAPNAEEYGRFFVAVSNAIRGLNDPRIRILNGAVTPANTTFIRGLMAVPGFVGAFDAWASHCYPFNHPPWYNIHQRTARYGNAVIDCYIEERDAIARYGGRTGFKFVITETGHGLGDNIYAFEGFPRISESNRASYISAAFNTYWRTWPEVIAVTPFQLGDPWSGWEWLDWVDYTINLDPFRFAFTPHQQFSAVAALNKPRGATVPHGFEVTFRARVDDGLPAGTYHSQLYGAATVEATAVLTQAAPVQVVSRIHRTYLPFVQALQGGGVWYGQALSESSTLAPAYRVHADTPRVDEQDGAIAPTHILTSAGHGISSANNLTGQVTVRTSQQAFGGSEPHLLALDGLSGHAYVGLARAELALLDLSTLDVERSTFLDASLQALASGPDAGMIYGALSRGEVILVDAVQGEVIARAGGLGRPQALVFDPITGNLLVADAQEGVIVRFNRNLSARLAARPLANLPGRMLLDATHRRLYVTLPGARRVLALDADTLQPVAEVELVGGPLIDMVLDASRGRLYVLSALSPEYRGLWVLNANDLSPLALLGGSPVFPLKQATALALTPDGHLLVAEGTDLYRISPEDFNLVNLARLKDPVIVGGLATDPTTSRVVWLDSAGISSTLLR